MYLFLHLSKGSVIVSRNCTFHLHFIVHFRLKSEIDRKDLEREESISRLSAKHQSELSDLKYLVQELEMNKKDLQNQINMFKAKQTEQESLDDIRTQNNQFKARLEQIDRANSGLTEENDRLKDELSYVSITVKCTFYFKLIIWEMFCVCI